MNFPEESRAPVGSRCIENTFEEPAEWLWMGRRNRLKNQLAPRGIAPAPETPSHDCGRNVLRRRATYPSWL